MGFKPNSGWKYESGWKSELLDLFVDKGTLAASPLNPQEGWLYTNSGDGLTYLYYGGFWQYLTLIANFLLLETADILLKEDGFKLALEA